MKHVYVVALVAAALLIPAFPPRAGAASKYNACGLLTADDLKVAVNANMDKAEDRDIVIPNGPSKGETMSTCTWVLGATYVTLNVIRAPQTAEQQAAGLSGLRTVEAGLVKKGWTVETGKVPGADCSAYKPPSSEGNARHSPRARCGRRGSASGSGCTAPPA